MCRSEKIIYDWTMLIYDWTNSDFRLNLLIDDLRLKSRRLMNGPSLVMRRVEGDRRRKRTLFYQQLFNFIEFHRASTGVRVLISVFRMSSLIWRRGWVVKLDKAELVAGHLLSGFGWWMLGTG